MLRLMPLVLLISMTACSLVQNPPSSAAGNAAPKEKLFAYTDDFKAEQERELKILDIALGHGTDPAPMCARDAPVAGCSATRRTLSDYHFDRNQMRTAGIQQTQ